VNLPEKYHGNQVRPAAARAPAVRGAPVAAPVHAARTLTFSDENGRDHWWSELSDKVRQRIAAEAGPTIEWWAFRHARERDRGYAVVLGPDALVVTTPQRSHTGAPTQRVHPYRFVPGSLKYATVTQRPSSRGVGGGGGGGAVGDEPVAAPSRLAISQDLRGFLGNLPAEAQQRMQGPFLAGDPVRDSGYFYHGSDEELDVWCFLAGRDNVMFISGRRVAPAGAPPSAACWDLICRHGRVAAG
jgi:hypothetical protein